VSIVILAPSADGGFAPTDTSSLREIEQEVARRVGPFQLRWVQNPQEGEQGDVTSTVSTISLPALRSSIDMGGLEDMFVLRRGRLRDGTLLPSVLPDGTPLPFTADDRIRMVRQYRPQEGVVEVDRTYLYATYDDEEVEFHHLDPEQELRPAALGGLRRCYVVHRLPIEGTIPGPFSPIDLTAVAPWLLTRDQVYGVSMAGGAPLAGWRVEPYGGGLYLTLMEYQYGKAYVVNRRPSTAMVLPAEFANGNGEGNGNGDWVVRAGNVNEPWDDEDRFAVPMDYAAAAGHIECWRTARPRMSLVAQTGMWADQKEAAAEFTRVSTVYFDPPRYDTMLSMSGRRYLDNDFSNAP
jgi:hypothetical protein